MRRTFLVGAVALLLPAGAMAAGPVYEAAEVCQRAGYRFQQGEAVATLECLDGQTSARIPGRWADIWRAKAAEMLRVAQHVDEGKITAASGAEVIWTMIKQADAAVIERDKAQSASVSTPPTVPAQRHWYPLRAGLTAEQLAADQHHCALVSLQALFQNDPNLNPVVAMTSNILCMEERGWVARQG